MEEESSFFHIGPFVDNTMSTTNDMNGNLCFLNAMNERTSGVFQQPVQAPFIHKLQQSVFPTGVYSMHPQPSEFTFDHYIHRFPWSLQATRAPLTSYAQHNNIEPQLSFEEHPKSLCAPSTCSVGHSFDPDIPRGSSYEDGSSFKRYSGVKQKLLTAVAGHWGTLLVPLTMGFKYEVPFEREPPFKLERRRRRLFFCSRDSPLLVGEDRKPARDIIQEVCRSSAVA